MSPDRARDLDHASQLEPSTDRQPADGRRRRPASWWIVPVVCLAWLALWSLTPGLRFNGPGSWLSSDEDVALLFECVLAVIVVTPLLLLHPRYNRVLFARSRQRWLYLLPVVLALTLPLHYGMAVPLPLYLFWMTVSVFWQNYLTFGLLQSYLRERLPAAATIALVAVMFWLGHAVFLPDRFGLDSPLPSLAILALGLLMAGLRARFQALHVLLALHLSFYFIFA